METTSLITIIDIINAGGVVAILIILVGGFYTGKIISRKVHDEMNEKQTMIVDATLERINGGFMAQSEKLDSFIGNVNVLAADYYEWQGAWRQALSEQTDVLHSIDTELKKVNGGEKGSTPVP